MTVNFMLSVDYPFGHLVQGDLGYVEVDVTDEEYALLKKYVNEDADPEDFPELQRVWDLLYAAGREMLEENEFEDDPNIEHWDPDDLEITIQRPILDDPDPIGSDLERWNRYMDSIQG